MKKLLILIDKKGETNETMAKFIGDYLGENSTVFLSEFSELVFEIGKGGTPMVRVGGKNIKDFAIVYFRRVGHDYLSTAGTLALCLDKLGIKYFDTKFGNIGPSADKFTSLTKLFLAGIPIPHTMFLWKKSITPNVGEIMRKLGNRVIAKEYGTQGNKQIFILKRIEDFKKLPVKVKNRDAEFLFQEFIDIDREYRLLVMKDKITVAHTKAVRDYSGLRVRDDTPADNLIFINPIEISENLKKTAVRSAQILGIEVAGVDICIEKGSGKVYVIEVNRGPGFWHDPEKSPELPELAKFFERELKINDKNKKSQ
jgi:ribosomal protein S6--L-glutamate ligase